MSAAATQARWRRPDGSPVSCLEKIKVLEENDAELRQTMQDAFEDAVLMGVDAAAMREMLHGMVDALNSPAAGDAGPEA